MKVEDFKDINEYFFVKVKVYANNLLIDGNAQCAKGERGDWIHVSKMADVLGGTTGAGSVMLMKLYVIWRLS